MLQKRLHRVLAKSRLFTAIAQTRKVHHVRNIGVIAHIDAGKTTTSEQMLFVAGSTDSVGRVDNGDTMLDFLPQEKERGITISSAAVTLKWKGSIINLIDTPGHVDFTIEVERSARVLDGAVLVVDAVAGVQAQTQTVWKQAKKQKIPAIAFVNKMDRIGANFERTVLSLKSKLGANAVPIQFPIGSEDAFDSLVDLISMTKLRWHQSISTRTPSAPIVESLSPSEAIYEDVLSARKDMIESIAENDEELMEKYLSVDTIEDIPIKDILSAIRRACIQGTIIPTLCGASLRGKGVEPILNAVEAFLPSPADRPPCLAVNRNTGAIKSIAHDSTNLCALAFKVVYDNARGPLVYVRTYAGTLNAKQGLFNSTRRCRERAHQVLAVSADDFDSIASIGPGNVACIVGLKDTVSGDTLVGEKSPLESFVLDGLTIPPAVYSVSIEPEKSSQQADLEKALAILRLEDPSLEVEIDKESGQTLLRGIGELHLDIVCDKLKRQYGIEVSLGKAYVAYRESLEYIKDGSDEDNTINITHTYDRVLGLKRMFARISAQIVCTGPTNPPVAHLDEAVKRSLSADEYMALTDALQGTFSRGPNGFPLVGISVTVTGLEKDADTTPGSIRACANLLIDAAMRSEGHTMLEPFMSIEVDAPSQFIGDVLSDLGARRRGHIREVTAHVGDRSLVSAEVPLATMVSCHCPASVVCMLL